MGSALLFTFSAFGIIVLMKLHLAFNVECCFIVFLLPQKCLDYLKLSVYYVFTVKWLVYAELGILEYVQLLMTWCSGKFCLTEIL